MSRLRYKRAAYVGLLQMSRHDVFVFVEGWSDRYFYDKLSRLTFTGLPISHQVRTSEELDTTKPGKDGLVEWFLFARRRKLLFHEFQRKKMAFVFFLDKDIDDLFRTLKQSKHLYYTEYYCLENHVYKHSDLVNVMAAVAALDEASITKVVGVQHDWLMRAASEWKEWVAFCVLTRRLGVNTQSNFGQHQSQINNGAYGGITTGAITTIKAQLIAASGMTLAELNIALQKTTRLVDRFYSAGSQDRIFKGKWYGKFLVEDARAAAAGRAYDSNDLEHRFLSAATMSLDFSLSWAARFKEPLEEIAKMF